MKNFTQKKQLVFAIIFFIITLPSLLFFYTNINVQEIASGQKLTEWRVEAARRDEIKFLDSSMKKIEGEKAMLETHFVQISNPVPFLGTLDKLAKSVNTEYTVSSFDASPDGTSLIVVMNATGNFEAFYKFLTLLENVSYDIEFVSIDMKKETDTNKWSAAIKIKLLTFVK